MRATLASLVVCAALAWPAPAVTASGPQGPPKGREVVLVANAEGGTVSIVDGRSFRVLREIDVLPDGPDAQLGEDDPFQALARQRVIEAAGGTNYAQDQDVSPDGRTLYVSRGHRGDVAAFDLSDGRLLWKVPIPGFRADHMTITEDGRFLYVSALTENVVVVIDTAHAAEVSRIPAGQWPHDNHLSEDGERLYNASIGAIVAPAELRGAAGPPYRLTIVATGDLSPLRSFDFDRGLRPIVLTHDERRMYAQLSEFHGLIEFDLQAGAVARTLELPIDAGVTEADYDFEAPHHGLAISHDERLLCAAGRASDYVALVATGDLLPVAVIEVGDAPGWAATGPDGRHCFVPNTRADTLSVISYAGRREVARLDVGDGPKQVEAARIPEPVICAAPDVAGCARDVRLVLRCLRGGRLRVALAGELDGIYGVRFGAGRRVVRDDDPPFVRTLRHVRSRRLRARVTTSAEPLRLRRRVPRCGRR